MILFDLSQGRALATMLPLVTLIAHAATFLAVAVVYSGSWKRSWCVWYDLAAVAASAVGLMGGIQRRPAMISAYALVHAITLTFVTFALFVNVLPHSVARALPMSSHVRYDANTMHKMCQDLDDGLGWDGNWLGQCRQSLGVFSTGTLVLGLVMIAVQWSALVSVWSWTKEMRRWSNDAEEKRADLEGLNSVDHKQGLGCARKNAV